MRLTDEERAEVRSRPFPVQTSRMEGVAPHPLQIPWSVADKAGCEYARRYGNQQSIERLAQRGGLSGGEMDDLYPAWREEVSEIAALKTEAAALRERNDHLDQEREASAQITGQANAKVKKLTAENARLRGLLRAPGLYPPTDETDRPTQCPDPTS